MAYLNKLKTYCGFVLLFFPLLGNCQYQISGYLKTDEKSKTVYLSLLKYQEGNSIYPSQIISTVETDSLGFFEFSGTALPEKDKYYRVHTNAHEGSSGLQIFTSGHRKNYHNFIFSNDDTLFFPAKEDVWFDHAGNTNAANLAYEKLISFEANWRKEHDNIINVEIRETAKRKGFEEMKQYAGDSISSPLVKLLAFLYLQRHTEVLENDFEKNPSFYSGLKDELNDYYNGASYYLEYQQEYSKLSYQSISEQLKSAKRLNFILLAIVVLLFVYTAFKLKSTSKNHEQFTDQYTSLTSQEKKVAELIVQGQTNKTIASALFISLSTVKSHIIGGKKIELKDLGWLSEGHQLRSITETFYEAGFKVNQSKREWAIDGVAKGSSAYDAGLRNGMKLQRLILSKDAAKQMQLTVENQSGKTLVVAYYPARKVTYQKIEQR